MLAKRYDNLKPELDDGDPVGDVTRFNSPDTHYHFPEKSKSKGLGTLAKLAIGAGLLGTGAGATVGIPILIDVLTSKVTTSVETRTNTNDWRIGQPIVE